MSEEKNPITLDDLRAKMDALQAEQYQRVSFRITQLVSIYGSRRNVGKALDIDHAYLHHLQKGTKQPSDQVLKRLGLLTEESPK